MSLCVAFAADLFDTSDFPARWHCGRWSSLHGWVHILSDIAIAGAYSMIPLALASYWWIKRDELEFSKLFWLFAAFIFSCGSTHAIEAVIFYHPVYRFAGLMKAITAVVSWATVIMMFRLAPRALELPGIRRANLALADQLTVTKRAEEALERSNRDLEAFTGLVTHDLRNPLGSAIFASELAREAAERGDSRLAAAQLSLASQSLRQMEALVRELHAESVLRMKAGETTTLALGGVVDSARLNLAPLIASSGAAVEIAGPLPEVRGSHTMLVQLFINLFENSIKYRHAAEPRIVVSELTGDLSRCVIRVADNGMGIPTEQTESIFGSGIRGENAVGVPGSGLGLAFCRRIMEAHGGTITAANRPDGGAAFDLTFPKAGDAA